jgi:hypothetical protein
MNNAAVAVQADAVGDVWIAGSAIGIRDGSVPVRRRRNLTAIRKPSF